MIFSGKTSKILGLLLLSAYTGVQASSTESSAQRLLMNCDPCETRLHIMCLCAQQIRTTCLDVNGQINAEKIYADDLAADNACFNQLRVRERACFNSLKSEQLCAGDLYADSFCLSGAAKFSQAEICQKFRATAVFAADTVYTLGDPLNFDTILDDPNGDVLMAPFRYVAPVAGEYVLTLQVDQTDIQGTEPILGVPVAELEIFVNGNIARRAFSPFLTFRNSQNATFSSLIHLDAGDEVSAAYEVFVLDENTGFQPYAGTVVVDGNGTQEDRSLFKIHYLSSDCANVEPCEPPCQECNMQCVTYAPCIPCSIV